jgi:hypothetical protein
MKAQLLPASLDGFWRKLFPGQILDRLLPAEPLNSNELELEGRKLVAMDMAVPTRLARQVCMSRRSH